MTLQESNILSHVHAALCLFLKTEEINGMNVCWNFISLGLFGDKCTYAHMLQISLQYLVALKNYNYRPLFELKSAFL